MSAYGPLPDPQHLFDHDEAAQAFADILDARASEEAIEAFLTALALRGETMVEIAAAAEAMRARLIPIDAPKGAIDVCGTGGDGHHTLNVSTAVSIVVAACDVPVAKHGNRAASSKSGAADTLEALGLNMERAGANAEAWVRAVLDPQVPLVWMTFDHAQCRSTSEDEVAVAARLLQALHEGGVRQEDMAVVTPYRRQARRLRYMYASP